VVENINLSGKNILITGGSMGIGYATAEVCLQSGGNVVICARNKTHLDTAVDSLKAQGYKNIIGIPTDVTQQQEIEIALDTVESNFGSLSAVIHAAGVLEPIGDITKVDPKKWFNTIETNLFGTFLITRQVACVLNRLVAEKLCSFQVAGLLILFLITQLMPVVKSLLSGSQKQLPRRWHLIILK
jgi:NAD(P)-dependent dehydrogenase (short-subunit alcohol dehydrogenase family)